MTRIAAQIYLVNTFLPILLAAVLVFAGWQSYRAYVELLAEPVARLEAKAAAVQAEFNTAVARVDATRKVLMAKGEEVERALDRAAAPFEAVAGAVGAVADAAIAINVPKPGLVKKDVNWPNGKPVKLGPWRARIITLSFSGHHKLRVGLPKPVKTAFSKIGAAFGQLGAVTKPLGEMAAAVKAMGPDLAPLQARAAELQAELEKARDALLKARAALDPVVNVVVWSALVIGPWLVISYLSWVWLRLRRWRVLLAGGVA
ncbi:MAG: hypothetical protein AAF409_08675 [Pseudomonadota bacterium]